MSQCTSDGRGTEANRNATQPAASRLHVRGRAAAGVVGSCSLLVALTACSSGATLPPRPTAPPVPTATTAVGFAVDVTAIPSPTPSRPRPTAVPTPFVAPPGPYVVIVPSTGPPVTTSVLVLGGHLPPSSAVDLVWQVSGKSTPLGTVVNSDRAGKLRTRFTIPASPPGVYRLEADIVGVVYAATKYRVVTHAAVTASVEPEGTGQRVQVVGRGFPPHLRVLLVAYPMFRKAKAVALGTAYATAGGRVQFGAGPLHLVTGEYSLHVWTAQGLTTDLAQTYFQVVL